MLLKDLISARTKLLKQKSGISVSVKELGNVNGKEYQKLIEKALKNAIEGVAKSIRNLEDRSKKLSQETRVSSRTTNYCSVSLG
jgi:hypothetical protein